MPAKKKYPGHLLVSNPNNPRDELSKSVILIVSHTERMAVGLQINNPLEDINLQDVANNLGMDYPNPDLLYYGGNMSTNKIHVVHSNDWQGMTTVQLNDEISVTNDISVLAALSRGEGPEFFRACAGYWLWDDHRLDLQLNPRFKDEPHKWEITPADSRIIFDGEGPEQWRVALDHAAKYQVNAWF